MELHSSNDTQHTTCSMLSRQTEEKIFGTATHTDVWLLLEYPLPWSASAFEESNIPGPVKTYLNSIKDSRPRTRIQLIKRPSYRSKDLAFFLAITRETLPKVYEFHLNDYEELLEIDINAAFSETGMEGQSHEKPLFLVCTDGEKDSCCTQWGLPLYEALSKIDAASTWQVSHIGGHRFAPNVVCFPHGIYYGRVDDLQAQFLIESCQKKQILLENYRGRSSYPPEIQAAEYYLREKTGILEFDAFKLKGVDEISENQWQIYFNSSSNNQLHQLHVSLEQLNLEIIESCQKPDKKSFVKEYRLVKYEAEIE